MTQAEKLFYGDFEGDSVDEGTRPRPRGIYANTKYMGERLVRTYNHLFGAVIFFTLLQIPDHSTNHNVAHAVSNEAEFCAFGQRFQRLTQRVRVIREIAVGHLVDRHRPPVQARRFGHADGADRKIHRVVGTGRAAQLNILIRNSDALQSASRLFADVTDRSHQRCPEEPGHAP